MFNTRLRLGLFWKILLALWASMILSMVVALFYLHYMTGELAPSLPPGVPTLGPLPLVPMISGLVSMLIVGIGIAWYLSIPLRHMSRGFRQVAQGKFNTRVTPLLRGHRDELSDLAEDFDRMAAQLEQLTQARQVLLHDISHELRSPLARMQAAIGLLRQDPSQTTPMIERIDLESNRLDVLIEELLTLHRIEDAPDTWSVEELDLVELLQAIGMDADFEARTRGCRVTLRAPDPFISKAHPDLLYRAFENVIRNAVKYTAPGTEVGVTACVVHQTDTLVVSVADQGPGVPAELRAQMFAPFARLDTAGSQRGFGLGLAIAQRSMDIHGGSITASESASGGLMMKMLLPRGHFLKPSVLLSDSENRGFKAQR